MLPAPDGVCSKGETPTTSPSDCAEKGDGLCTGQENTWSSPEDCPLMRISVNWKGEQLGKYASYAWVSADGSRILFGTEAKVTQDDTKGADVFVRDLRSQQTLLLTPRDGDARPAYPEGISDDGRWGLLETKTALIVEDTNNRWDVYAVEIDSGEIKRVSVQADGRQYGKDCYSRGFNAGGRYANFVCGSGGKIRYELETGQRMPTDESTVRPYFDATGTLQVFSTATPLLADDTNNRTDVYLLNHATDALERVSIRPDGIEANDGSYEASISLNGRFVAFRSSVTNLAPGGKAGIFVHDGSTGENLLVAPNHASAPRISGNGRFVVFSSQRADLVKGDTNGEEDVYLAYIGDWVDSLPSE